MPGNIINIHVVHRDIQVFMVLLRWDDCRTQIVLVCSF